MSDADADADPSLPTKVYRTVTPGSKGHKDAEMDVIGWGLLLGLLILLVPLLPFILIVWLITKLLDWFSGGAE